MADHQRIAASDAKYAIKDLGPQLRQARFMLIDVSGWAMIALAILTIGTISGGLRSKRAFRK